MNDPDQADNAAVPDEEYDLAAAKAASRRRDWEDVASGRRTAEQVRRDNTRPFWGDVDFTKIVILNKNEACVALGDDPPSIEEAEAEEEGANQPNGDERSLLKDHSHPA